MPRLLPSLGPIENARLTPPTFVSQFFSFHFPTPTISFLQEDETFTMERKASADNGVEVTAEYDDKATRRRQSAFARRKSSAVMEEPAAIVEASTLNDADRRLAEMGYTQASLSSLPKERY